MRRLIPATALLLALAGNAHAPKAQAATRESFEARVIGVADGDTIKVQISNAPPYDIRLAGIDAPEKGQAFGDRSKKNLSSLVHDQTVRIEWSKRDSYKRIVGKVLVGTTDVNLAQVSAGYAWHYKQYEKEQSKQDRMAYDGAERNAREQRLGLWKDSKPVPPWEWRHGNSKVSAAEPGEGPVRKSRNNICHDPSMKSYASVKTFTSYLSLDACLASGARLPRQPGD